MKATNVLLDYAWACGLRYVVFVAGLGLSLAASAGVTLSQFPPNPGVLPGGGWQFGAGTTFANPPPPRAWVNGVYGGVPSAIATDVVAVAGRAGTLGITAASSVTAADAVLAVGRCVMGMNPVCAAGTAAYLAYKAYRAMPASDVPNSKAPPGSLDYDPGQGGSSQSQSVYVTAGSPNTASVSQSGSCSTWASYFHTDVGSYATLQQGTGAVTGPTECTVTQKCGKYTGGQNAGYGCPDATYKGDIALTTQTMPWCPPSTDFENAAYSIPGGSAMGQDGKCPTARYNHQAIANDVDLAKMIANGILPHITPDWANAPWKDAVPAAIDHGNQSAPSEIVTSGPASQVGDPSTITTTPPSGVPTTTTSTNTYNYTYEGAKVTYNTTNNVTSTTGGDTTTITTSGGSDAAKPQDPKDPCTANPNRVGCMSLGDAPTDKVNTKTPNLSFNPDGVALPEGCPSAVLIQGRSYSYQPVCDAATNARPWVLVGAAFSALMLVLAAVRTI